MTPADPDAGNADQLLSVTALSSGQVLATGLNDTAALYDPVTGAWTGVALHGGVRGVMALRDGTALVFGTEGSTPADEEVWFAAQFDPRGSTRILGHWSPAIGAATAVLADGG